MPARARISSLGQQILHVAVAAQRDDVRMLEQQQLIGNQPLLALGRPAAAAVANALAVIDAPEFAHGSSYALIARP